MEEVSARRSSGVYDTANFGSSASLGSQAALRDGAAPPAVSRFSEGQVHQLESEEGAGAATAGTGAAGAAGAGNASQTAPAPEAVAPQVPFWQQKWFRIANLILLPLALGFLFIVLFPVVTAIVQMVVNRSSLNVDVAAISQPQNTSFVLEMQGFVAHTGVFNARIDFPEPIDVSWMEQDGTETHLGTMTLSRVWGRHKRATINQTTTFNIADEDTFGRFAQYMITSEEFTWRLKSDNLAVQAVKFPVSHGIKFDKYLTLKGMNSFNGNVILKDLKLPSDNPAGGINFISETSLNNPSPFKLNLGTVVFMLNYKGLDLGTGTGYNTVITPGDGNDITLSGYLKKQEGEQNLATISELFTQYLNGEESPVIAKGLSTLQNDGTTISWLSKGLTALSLHVPFKAPGAISPIKSINIGDMSLGFLAQAPWTPSAESHTVQAQMSLPFGFNLAIGEIQNDFNITYNNQTVAGLKTPLGASTSNVKVYGETDTRGSIDIQITDSNLSCPDPSHSLFSQFNANLTSQDKAEFRMSGHSRAVTNTSVGQITLDPIKVDLPTNLFGLQGLKGMTTINAVDVIGGSTQGINLAINTSIHNPSNLKLSTGDLHLQLFRNGALLGTALMPNLTLNMGDNQIAATSSFEANNSPEGLQTLNEFVGGTDVEIKIAGYDGSTAVSSLLQAFKTLDLDVNLPALQSKLLESAALKVLPTTGTENNLTHVTVDMANPFSSGLTVTSISSSIKSYGIDLGSIETSTEFNSKAKTTTTSPELDLSLNFDPESLFTVTRNLAVDAGLSTAQLDGIMELGGYHYVSDYQGSSSQKREKRDNIYTGFKLPDFVDAAFKKLNSDVQLKAGVTLGEYQTSLEYKQNTVPTKTDESLHYILPVLAKPIVNKIVAGSGLSIDTVLISDPKQDSFSAALKGSISNAGPFDATISFPSGLSVAWNGKALGTMKMSDIQVTGDVGATLDATSAFSVSDVDHLTEFSKTLLTSESFEWDISGENLTVKALGIEVSGITFPSKKVSLKGFNGLKGGVTIKSFDLPSNDEAGGIHLTLEADTTNPSQVGMELSALGFANYAQNSYIGPAASNGSVTLNPQSTTAMSLVGRLVPQDSSEGLAAVSTLFNNFIHGKDSDVVVQGDYAGPSDVTWLNEAIKVLKIETKLPNQGVQNIMKTIAINEMTLMFTDDTAYNPDTSSKVTDAAFTIPFAFPIEIKALESNIDLGYQGTTFAQLALPRTSTTTDVQNRIIHMPFQGAHLKAYDDQHSVYDDFLAATTMSESQTFTLASSDAKADAGTAVGVLSLSGISFNVETSIKGLQGLNARPVTVANLDVNHGYPDYLLIKVDGSLYNPSNLTIGAGDVSLNLQYENVPIGTTVINDLVIVPDNHSYPIDVHFSPQGDAVSTGRKLLENFISGVDVDTSIAGSRDSTPIDSLKEAFSEISLSPVTIPAMKTTLIQSTSIVFPTDIVQTGKAWVSFVLANPFTASINLLKVDADATYEGLNLASIDNVDLSSSPVHADGHTSVTSQYLPLTYNLDPVTIIKLLTTLAQENNVDLGPTTELFQFILSNPDYHPPVKTSVDTGEPPCVSGHQFDVAGAILKALAGLKVDLSVETSTKIDDYPTDLSISQNAVPTHTDETALYLIGAVAGPVAQHLVDGAELKFSGANITGITNEGFDLALTGSLTNTGPLDARIEFTEPVKVTWQGNSIAEISLEPVCISANEGLPDYRTNAHLTITDQGQFTNFATYLLHNPDFTWTISTDKLRLTALGTIFDNVSLQKDVSFKAFNNLPGVTISNFQLPSDDPAGGIHIETDALIPSPSNLGIELGTVGFQAFFKGTNVGPLSANDLSLAPLSEAKTHLAGRIVPQSGSDLDNMGELFSKFLQGDNQTLTTKGDSVQPPGAAGPVDWLSTAFKTLSLDVTLPGQKYQVIQSISLNDLEVTLTDGSQTWAPPTGSNSTMAVYKNPFGFSLQVVKSGQTITLGSHGTDIAELDIPLQDAVGDVSTGNDANLPISFHDIPLKSLNNGAFQLMFDAVTNTESIALDLKGSANVSARTTIGDVRISGIPFDVDSSLKGINGFGHTATLSDIKVTGSGGNGGSEYIKSPLTTKLENPSNVTLHTNDVALPVTYKGTSLGRAAIDPFNLVPGENTIATEFHYQPADANDTTAQSFLTDFITTGNDLPITIDGDTSSSPYESLASAMDHVQIQSSIQGLNSPEMVKKINAEITLETLITDLINLDFDIYNPLDAPLVITQVQGDGYVDGERYATFTQPFDNLVVPPKSTANSGKFGNVLLVKGALASLGIIGRNLDIKTANTVKIDGGYEVPWLKIDQTNVDTSYTVGLGLNSLDDIFSKAKALSASSVSKTATTNKPSSTGGGDASTTGGSESSPTSSSEGGNSDDSSSSPTSDSAPKESETSSSEDGGILPSVSLR